MSRKKSRDPSRLYTLSVEGLVCPLCAFSVQRNLTAIKGVHDGADRLQFRQTLLTMADGAALAETDARAAIESAGFKLRAFEEVQSAPRK